MKKIYLLVLLMVLCSNYVFAKNTESLYVVKNTKTQDYVVKLKQVLTQPTVDNNILYSTNDNYFIRLYQSNKDINIFLSCDKKEQELYQNKIYALGPKAYLLTDKDIQNKYSSDYSSYVELNNIALDNVKVEKNKYNPYNKPLPNKVIQTIQYSENNINFVAKRVKMKSKIKRYVEGYDITITNNTGSNIVLKQVNSGDFVSLYDIAKKAALPAGVDFVPVYGIVAGVKTDLEKNRFTRPFPTNYTIKNNESVRILGLTKLLVSPIVDFKFEINGKEKDIQLNTYQ